MGKNNKTLIIGSAVLLIVIGSWMAFRAGTTRPNDGSDTGTAQDKHPVDCANVKIPKGQELDISADPAAGLVTVGYHDEAGNPQEVVLSLRSNDNFAGCSEDARRILTDLTLEIERKNRQ